MAPKSGTENSRATSSVVSNSSSYKTGTFPYQPFLPAPPAAETIETFASDCTTPKTDFDLGQTVCAKITGAPLGSGGRAAVRIGWVSPYGSLAQGADITTDPQTGSYVIPTSQTQTFTDSGGGTVVADNRGTWTIGTYSAGDGSRRVTAEFTVHDPATAYADLTVNQATSNDQPAAGSTNTFSVFVTNRGPDAAQNVVLTGAVPNDSTFDAFVQSSGPAFSCTTPAVGGTGAISCTIASLARGDSASFDLAYTINGTATVGTVISNTATASSDTGEVAPADNASTLSATVGGTGGGGGGTCTVACPDDITTPANTVDGSNNPGAIVHFSPPSGNLACGTVTADHCNDCFFPQGATVVTGTSADTGESCSFVVTVTPAGSSPTISCPANQTGTADNDCSASINPGTATATGTNVTVIGFRSDGQPMYTCDDFGNCTRKSSDAPFSAGTTTITWFAYSHDVAGPYTAGEGNDEESHRTGSSTCSQTIVVNDVTPPVIAATNSTVSADENCQALVPDYSNTVSDNCACSSSDTSDACAGHPHFTYTQTPAAGTPVGIGSHTVHIESNDGSSNNGGAGNTATKDVTFTVNDTTAPAISCPANIVRGNDPGTCSATVDPGTATATDNCDSSPTIAGTRSDNQALNAPYPKGTTLITWSATDDAGNTSSCQQSVTVNDTEAPVITFNGQTPSMWPPNHSYQTFSAANFISAVSDNCDSLSVSDVDIISATSDEVENGDGDGNTLNDIIIAAGCKSIQLRAERQNNGNGRVYTITFRLRDTSGNTTTGTAKVYAPKNEGETPGNDGAHYSVSGNCP
jgi:uncharacterized repeat protein (TIGR01451 family)